MGGGVTLGFRIMRVAVGVVEAHLGTPAAAEGEGVGIQGSAEEAVLGGEGMRARRRAPTTIVECRTLQHP